MGIPKNEILAWADRLGGRTRGSTGGAGTAIPDWMRASRVVLRGKAGLRELSTFAESTAASPEQYEADLVRAGVGEVMLFSTLETPNVVNYGGLAHGPDVVIIGRTGSGLQRLHRRPTAVPDEMGVGRMGFMSSLAPSTVEHIGLTETTGLMMPTDLLGPVRDRLSAGVGLIPDTILTRAAGDFLAHILVDRLRNGGSASSASDPALESAIVGLARTVVGQSAESTDGLSATMRAEAMDVIERLYPDPTFDARRLATELHVSRRQLYRYFADAPRSIHESIHSRRLAAVRGLILTHPQRDLESIARECGFADGGSMRARFLRAFGMSPSAFRRSAALAAPVPEAMLLSTEQAASGGRSGIPD
jgi:AraC family transcriptional regulator, positive regulator of tynA and feaB